MNKLSNEKRAQVLQMMAEGLALRAITRLTGISRTTLINFPAFSAVPCGDVGSAAFRHISTHHDVDTTHQPRIH
jgi:hypothetical protein